jgi:hypothetical protein
LSNLYINNGVHTGQYEGGNPVLFFISSWGIERAYVTPRVYSMIAVALMAHFGLP